MFEYYIVVNKPVPVYNQPSSIGSIINAYNVGTKVGVIKVDAGWLYTDSGTYVFQSDDIIPYKKYKIENEIEEVESELLNTNIPVELRLGKTKLKDTITLYDNVAIKEPGVKDVYTNDTIPLNWVGKIRVVVAIDGTNITIKDAVENKSYTVPASCLEIYDGDNKFRKPLASGLTGIIDSVSDAVNTVKNYINSFVEDTTMRTIGAMSNYGDIGITDLRQVYGMPYQYLPWVDNRVEGIDHPEKIGRKYGQKIVSRAPVLIMQAGEADFMRGFSDDESDFMYRAAAGIGQVMNSELKNMANTPGRFYGFKNRGVQYFEAVNQMARAMAQFLGIGGETWTYPGGSFTLSDAQWDKASENPNIGFYSGLGRFYGKSVAFYINSEPQISESISNGTTRSMLDRKMNELGRMASEIQFLLGGASGATNIETATDLTDSIKNSNQDVRKAGTVGGVLDSIIENVQVLMIGGRMAFPEIWADSQFSRSYSVTIKLDSPDCDNMSIFMNILLPLAHILGFVLPRSVGSNNYISPYLVRAYYKSMFHIDMGIITGCNITKGDVGAWTQNGLPTQVTVQLEIKDLYNVISLSTGLGGSSITSNLGQLDYIANMCGINVDAPDIQKTLGLWMAVHSGAIGRKLSGLWDHAIIEYTNRFWEMFSTRR